MNAPSRVPDTCVSEEAVPTDLTPNGRPPRVLHLTQPVDGGVARVVTDLVRAQLADGLDVAAVCPDSPLTTRLRSLGAHLRTWEATRSPGPSLVREVRQLKEVVDELRPDLIHAHSAKAGLAGRLAVRGRIPTVFQPHAWSFEAVGGSTAALALRWERWAARWASRVICVSEAERDTGVGAGIRGRWTVVPNGIDPERFRPAEDTRPVRAQLAARHGMDADAPLVVCVGRLCRQKGQDVLLRAWDAVRRQVPGARLALVGDGRTTTGCAPARPTPCCSRGPSRTRRPGTRPPTSSYCRPAGRAWRWPRWRRWPARGPVVTDVDGARESLPPSLAGRCLVPPEDPRALARTVAALLLDPPLRASLGDRARRHVLSLHDVRHTARAVADVYRDLLGARPAVTGARPLLTAEDAEADRTTQRVEHSEHRESIHS